MGKIAASRRAGLLAAFFFAVNPFVWFYGEVAEIYIVEAALSALAGYLLYRFSRDKEEAEFLRATIILGLCGGFRMNAEIFLLPLWLALLFRYRGRPPFLKPWKYLPALAAATALWLAPTLVHCGGLSEYLRLSQRTLGAFFETNSVLYGASFQAHARMMMKLAAWCAIGAGPLAIGALAVLFRNPDASPDRKTRFFFMIWAAPALLFFTLVYIAKPGYLLFVFPPFFAFCGAILDRHFKRTGAACVFAALVVLPGLCYFFSKGVRENEIPFQLSKGRAFHRLFRYTASDIRYRDFQNDACRALLQPRLSGGRKSVFIFSSFSSWHFRTANYDFPEIESHFIVVDPFNRVGEHCRFQYGRIFTVGGPSVEVRGREACLFMHEASPWGKQLKARGLTWIGDSPDMGCFVLPAGACESIDFSPDSVRFIVNP